MTTKALALISFSLEWKELPESSIYRGQFIVRVEGVSPVTESLWGSVAVSLDGDVVFCPLNEWRPFTDTMKASIAQKITENYRNS